MFEIILNQNYFHKFFLKCLNAKSQYVIMNDSVMLLNLLNLYLLSPDKFNIYNITILKILFYYQNTLFEINPKIFSLFLLFNIHQKFWI